MGMEIGFAFFADAATLDSSGKLSVLGVFDHINAKEFPATLHKMCFVCKIKGHRSEIGKYKLKVNLVDQDGKGIIDAITGEIENAGGSEPLSSTLILELTNVVFPYPGQYAADITIDNHHMGTSTINANRI
jgi:hypothetical protein